MQGCVVHTSQHIAPELRVMWCVSCDGIRSRDVCACAVAPRGGTRHMRERAGMEGDGSGWSAGSVVARRAAGQRQEWSVRMSAAELGRSHRYNRFSYRAMRGCACPCGLGCDGMPSFEVCVFVCGCREGWHTHSAHGAGWRSMGKVGTRLGGRRQGERQE